MSESSVTSKTELLERMQTGWDALQRFIQSLNEVQLNKPTDAAGWTVKDHLIHLAVWENGIVALLNRQSRREQMGIDEATWDSHDFDQINAVIQERFQEMPLEHVLATLEEVHQHMVEKIQSMSDEALQQPCSAYDPTSQQELPVIVRVTNNTYAHYEEHIPWMQAIVDQPTAAG